MAAVTKDSSMARPAPREAGEPEVGELQGGGGVEEVWEENEKSCAV